ncbi:hypothetical protein MWH28_05385 [Natroniella sulfidigena]|uniref:hypothetical protein n=1 Tax=Natroniella sulfidigena TaxID=723921 RepID=UPI00200A1939|nr:hypothetical protein [Natroniella sulfidigena]MCK8816803.1 hypothetical protein [Natroniella sulfidigena]
MFEELVPAKKDREEAITDVLESTALARTALAQLVNAEAEELKKVVDWEDMSAKKLLKFQKRVDQIMRTGIDLQQLLRADLEDILKLSQAEVNQSEPEDVMEVEVEEEIIEEVADGKKTIKKVITKKRKD